MANKGSKFYQHDVYYNGDWQYVDDKSLEKETVA